MKESLIVFRGLAGPRDGRHRLAGFLEELSDAAAVPAYPQKDVEHLALASPKLLGLGFM